MDTLLSSLARSTRMREEGEAEERVGSPNNTAISDPSQAPIPAATNMEKDPFITPSRPPTKTLDIPTLTRSGPIKQPSFTHPPHVDGRSTSSACSSPANSLLPNTFLRSLHLTPSSASLGYEASVAIASVEAAERVRERSARHIRHRSVSITSVGAPFWSWEYLDSICEDERRQPFDGLPVVQNYGAAGARNHVVEPTPLPKSILFVLCIIIFSEPMSMTILFPFVYFMVRDFGMTDEKDIGFYVGFIASAFSLAQFLTSIWWGWLSDKIGRRPVLLIGLLGNALSVILFGTSNSLRWCILSRALCGFLNGNIGVAKCVMGEVTDSTNQAKGFSIFGLVWGVGSIMGPVIGGVLAKPAEKWPEIFAPFPLLVKYPYLLPCIVSAFISCIGLVVGCVFLEETAPGRGSGTFSQRGLSHTAEEERPLLSNSTTAPSDIVIEDETDQCRAELSRWESDATAVGESQVAGTKTGKPDALWSIGSVAKKTIFAYSMLSFQNIMLDEVFSLWTVTPPRDGGLGFTSTDIGFSLSIMGVVTLICQLGLYPSLSRRFGAATLYRIAMPCYIFVFLAYPLVSTYVSTGEGGSRDGFVWPVLLLVMTCRTFLNVCAFTSIMIMINNAAPLGKLGIVNGISQTSAAFVRSVGPCLGGSLWAWSLTNSQAFPLNHWFVFFFLMVMGSLASLQSWIVLPSMAETLSRQEYGSLSSGHV
ncbi:hypothetical protein SmJEL517_g00556 [Synchytrium microbalum]|uniref:Major facilitator superfamily (MFS) profile domain-containing protein n=1 Tax=Synchytrium microbalum TaxID=1806994 RepID=A0A507CES5_9FUNG|nr:uncharacterized protein SmJEL517_g00556 [Synchytrium microbalum]TPX37689.1 hypothetical protein SmJEL517_g00556 [Synchytrium microbalum]